MVRDAKRRIKKYKAKLDGTISQLRLKKYGKNQKNRFRAAVIKQIGIERTVKSLVSGSAPSMLLHFYCNFGKKVVQLMKKHKGANLINELNILDTIWSTRGLDTTLLGNIKTHFVPGYEVPVPPVVCDWGYKMKLTFSGNVSPIDLDDFPVLIHLTNANFDFTHARPLGQDIRFMDSDTCPSDGTPLYYEIENWDSVGEEAFVWVKVPRIDGSSAVDFIYMFFGNNAAADAQDAPNVWDADFMMVEHMYDNPNVSTITGSTSYGHVGTKIGANEPIEIPGRIYRGQHFDGGNDRIDIPHHLSISLAEGEIFSIEHWVKLDDLSGRMFFLAKGDPADWVPANYYTSFHATPRQFHSGHINSVPTSFHKMTDNTVSPLTWYYLVIIIDTSVNPMTITFYVNGALWTSHVTGGDPTVPVNETPNPLRLGGDPYYHFPFDGIMDEIRISDTDRSSDWIEAQHLSMSDALITYGAEE